MTISSILKVIYFLKCYNIYGDIMSFKNIVLDFEKNKLEIILKKLDEVGCNQINKIIIEKHDLILLHEDDIVLNKEFDFKVHLEVLYNYVVNYTRCDYYKDDSAFIEIVLNDFNLYWLNIEQPKLL